MWSSLAEVDYKKILDAAWSKAKADRIDNAPTVISTFAGCGGSSLGYHIAGFNEIMAVEWDKHAVECFKLNFPDVDMYQGDIAELSVDETLERCGLKPGELDVLDGSPPCQGFSAVGSRIIEDPRNSLFKEFVRLIEGLKPKVFVMENVSGMVKGKMKLAFSGILEALRELDYNVSVRLLNSQYFNVPQIRERLIFIGVRKDLNINPSHPKATSNPITVKEAWRNISSLNDDESFRPHVSKGRVEIVKNIRQGESASKYHPKGHCFGTRRLDWNKPCNTVLNNPGDLQLHPDIDEGINIAEIKRVSSYPDEFRFTAGHLIIKARIGNSVPPLFMAAIAEHIRANILMR